MSAADDVNTIKDGDWYAQLHTSKGDPVTDTILVKEVDIYIQDKFVEELRVFLDTKTAAEVLAICAELMS